MYRFHVITVAFVMISMVLFFVGVPYAVPTDDAADSDAAIGNVGSKADTKSLAMRAGPTNVSGVLPGSTTWLKSESPYIVTDDVTVSSGDTLTIEPGVIVKFNTQVGLFVNGILKAEGAPGDSIIFTSYRDDYHGGDTNGDGPSQGSNGDWEWISINGGNSGSIMSYCGILFAGQGYYTTPNYAIRVANAGTDLVMNNCLVENTRSNGNGAIYVDNADLSISNSRIQNNEKRAIQTSAGTLVISNCCIMNNGDSGIYTTADSVSITDSRVINNEGYGIYLTGANCEVTDCSIINNDSHGLYFSGLACAAVSDTVETNGGRGIYFENLPTGFSQNLITGNGDWGVEIQADLVDKVWSDGNVMTDNGRNNAIAVRAGTINASAQWIDEHTYGIFGNVYVADAVTFTLEAGAIMKFYGDVGLIVYGTLLAVGAEGDPIVFTAYTDDDFGGDTNGDGPSSGSPGAWRSIRFPSPEPGSELTYCTIRYAGRYYHYAYHDDRFNAIDLDGTGATLIITNSIIEETYSEANSYDRPYAIWGHSGTALDISETIICSNGYTGIYAQGSLILLNSQVYDNGHKGVLAAGDDSEVKNCYIYDNGYTGLEMTGASSQAVNDSCAENGGYGLYISQPDSFRANYSSGNTLPQFVVPVDWLTECWLSNTALTGEAVGALGGSIPGSVLWIDEHPIAIYGDITVPHDLTLTLEAGTIIKFDRRYDLNINGQLIANAAQGDTTVFTSYFDDEYGGDTNGDGSSTGTSGDWGYIKFDNTNAGCVMNYCLVRYGGYDQAALYLNGAGAQLAMSNCVVERSYGGTYPYAVAAYTGSDLNLINSRANDNDEYGFYLEEPATLVTGCSADGNIKNGFYVHPELVGEVIQDNSQVNNGYGNSVAMIGGAITADDEWPRTYTLMVNGTVTVQSGASLVIYKGTVVKFTGNYDLIVEGELVSWGDALEKVIFSSFKDDAYGGDTNEDGINTQPAAGDWGQIRFNGSSNATPLNWTVVSYGGYGNDPAVQIDNCVLDLSECIIHSNLDRAILVGATAQLDINNSDIYGNPGGLENQNTGYNVDARNVWWGDVTGPSGAGPGTGDPVSSYVLYDPWLDRSIDNPWVVFTSPAATGDYADVLIYDLDEDDFMDIVAATNADGIELYTRLSLEAWQSETSPITTGQVLGLAKGDFNNDNHEDLLACGPFGIRCFQGTGTVSLVEVSAPLAGAACNDAQFAYINQDQYMDVIGISGNNNGVWVFYGDGLGNWTPGVQPATVNTYKRLAAEDLNNDTHLDIVATNGEHHGIHIWYGAADSTWSAAPALSDGDAFFGLALGDIDKDGDFDLAAGSNVASVGIQMWLYDAGSWIPFAGPTTTGIYNDIILADLNGDARLDLAGASQGGGINVWVGTSSLFWNFWYHPVTSHDFNGIDVGDFTLNGSLDLAGAASVFGLALWDNQTPGVFQEYFETIPDNIDFGPVALTKCAYEDFQLENINEVDSVHNVVVYTTNPAFEITYAAGGGGPGVGPFDMAPRETVDLRVTYCPVVEGAENEVIIIHSSVTVTNMRITAEGVQYIQPAWLIDLSVQNALGAPDSEVVTFGGGIGATDSLDTESGEVCLPPVPPSTIFDTRFLIEGCEGSLVNIHDYYAEKDTFVLQWQAGSGGYPVTVSWNPDSLPDGTYLISDLMGGVFVDTLNMADTSQVVIPPEHSFITQLAITVFRRSTFDYDLAAGWHLLSRAVTMEEDSLQDLFPGAVSAFTWSDGYTQVEELNIGHGYWVDMAMDTTASHLGEQVRSIQRTLSAGWSLVGTVFDTVNVADIQQIPSSSIVSIFGFDGGYYIADYLIPGQAYWFDVSQTCEITIAMGPGYGPGPVVADRSDPRDIMKRTDANSPANWRLPIMLENGASAAVTSKTLIIGCDENASDGIDPALGERCVPPWPPSSVFETRLLTDEGVASYCDVRKAEPGAKHFEITWQAGEEGYPVTVSWNPDLIPADLTLTLQDNTNGSFIRPVDMRTISSVSIDKEQNFLTGLRMTVEAVNSGPPPVTEYALMQNVPNPFNPSTTVRFDLVEQVHVKLYIFDVSGRRVKTLVDRIVPAGRRSIVWNGRNDQGELVASGVYFYRIDAGGWTKTRKLVFVK